MKNETLRPLVTATINLDENVEKNNMKNKIKVTDGEVNFLLDQYEVDEIALHDYVKPVF